MTDKRFVASNRDIILFSIISVFASIFVIITFFEPNYLSDYEFEIFTLFFLFLPEIIAIIINKIIEHFNIQNSKKLKITKILFNIFTCINFAFWGFIVYVLYTLYSYYILY